MKTLINDLKDGSFLEKSANIIFRRANGRDYARDGPTEGYGVDVVNVRFAK